MNISRRKFMKAGIMVAACAGIPLQAQFTNSQEAGSRRSTTPPAIEALPEIETDVLSYYNRSTFAPHVNTEFRVRLNSSKVRRIKLVEVRDYMDASAQQRTMVGTNEECFSLFFTAPSGKTFPQNTYEVEHAALGKFMLFIVPVGMRTSGDQYFEAAFNRCTEDSTLSSPLVTGTMEEEQETIMTRTP